MDEKKLRWIKCPKCGSEEFKISILGGVFCSRCSGRLTTLDSNIRPFDDIRPVRPKPERPIGDREIPRFWI
jgi:uncharacterized Zn finger protein (UPF0148 family)